MPYKGGLAVVLPLQGGKLLINMTLVCTIKMCGPCAFSAIVADGRAEEESRADIIALLYKVEEGIDSKV